MAIALFQTISVPASLGGRSASRNDEADRRSIRRNTHPVARKGDAVTVDFAEGLLSNAPSAAWRRRMAQAAPSQRPSHVFAFFHLFCPVDPGVIEERRRSRGAIVVSRFLGAAMLGSLEFAHDIPAAD